MLNQNLSSEFKRFRILMTSLMFFCASFFFFSRQPLDVEIEVINHQVKRDDLAQLFWKIDDSGYIENLSLKQPYASKSGEAERFHFLIPTQTSSLRFDPVLDEGKITIKSIRIRNMIPLITTEWTKAGRFEGLQQAHGVSQAKLTDEGLLIETTQDPYIYIESDFNSHLASLKIKLALFLALCSFLMAPIIFLSFTGVSKLFSLTIGRFPKVRILTPYNIYIFVLILLTIGAGYYINSKRKIEVVYPPNAFHMTLVDRAGNYLVDNPFAGNGKQLNGLKFYLDPFVLLRMLPDQKFPGYTINRYGFREAFNPEDSRPILAVIGGSAAFSLHIEDETKTLTAQLGKLNPQFQILNAGVTGYLSGQELGMMIHYLDEYHPQVYLSFTGWNDFNEQIHPVAGHSLGYNKSLSREIETSIRFGCQSCIKPETKFETVINDDKEIKRNAQGFVSYLSRMNAFAKARGAKYFAVLQPEITGRTHLTDTEREFSEKFFPPMPFSEESFRNAYRKFTAESYRLAKLEGISIYNMSSDPHFQDQKAPVFLDQVHLNENGAEIAAQLITQNMASALKGSSQHAH